MTQKAPHSSSAHCRGIAMVLAMAAVAMTLIVTLSFITSQSTTLSITQNIQDQSQARMIAESGLAMSVRYVRTVNTWRAEKTHGAWVTDQAFAGGSFSVRGEDGEDANADDIVEGDGDLADDVSDKLTLTVTGRFAGASHVVRAVITPEPAGGGTVVLVVRDPQNLSAAEAAKKELIEWLGYTVVPVNDDGSEAAYEAALDGAAVVYITQGVNAGVVGVRLFNVTCGVVTEDAALHDELGFSAADGALVGAQQINITDNAHHVSAAFPLGALNVSQFSGEMTAISGALAPGAAVLATRTDNATPVLAIIERGAALVGGSPAAGRRAALPWGGSSFDIDSLTAQGRTLLHKSLQWASATPSDWLSADVGTPSPPGSSAQQSGMFMIYAAGLEIGGASDQFHYVYRPLTGNGELIVRVAAVPDSSDWGMAGIMVRETLAPGSRHVTIAMTHQNGAVVTERTTVNGLSEQELSAATAPRYLKIVREGDQISTYKSATGADGSWEQVGAATTLLGLPQTVLIGMAVSSHQPGQLDTGAFDSIALKAITEDEDSPAPKLVAEYRFEEVKLQPRLVHHWKLDEVASSGGGALGHNRVTMDNQAVIDSYNSGLGPYSLVNRANAAVVVTNSTASGRISLANKARIGGDVMVGAGGDPSTVISASKQTLITGTRGAQATNIPLPAFSAPTDMPASQGDKTYTNALLVTDNRRFNTLTIDSGATLTISGNVTILCDTEFYLKNNAKVIITPGSTLKLYVNGPITLDNGAVLNPNTANPGAAQVYGLSTSKEVIVKNQAQISAVVYTKYRLQIDNHGELFGSVVAYDEIYLKNHGKVHVDAATAGVAQLGPAPPADDAVGDVDGAYVGAAPGRAGAMNYAAEFDGVSDHVKIPHADSMLLDYGAISFWFRSTNLSGQHGLVSKDAGAFGSGGHLAIYTDGAVLRARLQSTTASHDAIASTVLAANTWYHVVLNFGPTGMQLYVNGALAASGAHPGGLSTTSGGSGNREPLVLGASAASASSGTASPLTSYFAGFIDDVRIYDRPLDAPQALKLAQKQTDIGATTAAGYVIADTSGYVEPLDLYIADTSKTQWLDGGGLAFNSATIARSILPSAKVRHAVAATGQMSLEAIFVPADLTLGGPANIVSDSLDTTQRNFTLGQDGEQYDWRLRTSTTGINADASVRAGSLAIDARQHVLISYDGEYMRLYRNGVLEKTEPRDGTLSTWAANYTLMMANELSDDRPWLGRLYRVAIYDRALNALQVEDIFNGLPPGEYGDSAAIRFRMRWLETP